MLLKMLLSTKSIKTTTHHHLLCFLIVLVALANLATANEQNDDHQLTACQHLRRAESRRAKAIRQSGTRLAIAIPKCSPHNGAFEPIQCSNEINGANTECWCVDEYGIELQGTRQPDAATINCTAAIERCPASSCRMYCPSGFKRAGDTGCPLCQCRDPCDGVECPGDLACQAQEVQCSTEPCPPVPTCKKARTLSDICPAGYPLTISDTVRPFLCGLDPGKPTCPPMYKCFVQQPNDYGVCCPTAAHASMSFQKPGNCPHVNDIQSSVSTGVLCGVPCSMDLECPQQEKCCQSKGCGSNCRQPHNVTMCHQARMLTEVLSVNEREGRGYLPQCDEATGRFAHRQCSRNGLVCWCVDPLTGNKMLGTMGAAAQVECDGRAKSKETSRSRSVEMMPAMCDKNICASVCEYGFKIDHNQCPTCECSEPCEGFACAAGSHCEVAKDPQCRSSSALCASEPVCKPDLVYTNPCDEGIPLASNKTGEVFYCRNELLKLRNSATARIFSDEIDSNNVQNLIECPDTFECVSLFHDSKSVCCPRPSPSVSAPVEKRPQSMCEYIRDFSDRMESTDSRMTLALPMPRCHSDGSYSSRMCVKRRVNVTIAEQRRILEKNDIEKMKLILAASKQQRRAKRSNDCPLYKCVPCEHGYKTDADGCRRCECLPPPQQRKKREMNAYESEHTNQRSVENLSVDSLLKYLRQNILVQPQNSEANYMAEILSRKLLNEVMQSRNSKLIDANKLGVQSLMADNESTVAVRRGTTKLAASADTLRQLHEMEVDECFCVDGFGTEIPRSRGTNVTDQMCDDLRVALECLDITCRMGCDYGFVLDPDTRCPTCECRDPCDSITCGREQECRLVEVSCDGEYCPPVPACLPRKPGQCPFLVPPGAADGPAAVDTCEYECRSDMQCADHLRCCSNGCGTQCVEPQLKTACQHLQTIQLHQATELGQPANQKYIVQCNEADGSWTAIQCGPGDVCWCVDERGNERSGTRRANGQRPNCGVSGADSSGGEDDEQVQRAAVECPSTDQCAPCEFGNAIDQQNGCRTCVCRDPCAEISCPGTEQCQLIRVECTDGPCPMMAVCVPQRESVCTEGLPFKRNGQDLVCGPNGDAELCPSTHTCQLDVSTKKGACCAKTRDVCFESVDANCIAADATSKVNEGRLTTKWRFSPKSNKCVQFNVADESMCHQSKNMFHSHQACESVCPVLSQCERLRLRNSLAVKRVQQPLAWFQPKCDPDTGSWSPIQCLGKASSPAAAAPHRNGISREFSLSHVSDATNVDSDRAKSPHDKVCWCADRKGTPIKGSLTRNAEPMCNQRQARRRMMMPSAGDSTNDIHNAMIEQLINQMTLIADSDDTFLDFEQPLSHVVEQSTEAILKATIQKDSSSSSSSLSMPKMTRCQAIQESAPFRVVCNEHGAFEPMQCHNDVCWCVDSAGNQLAQTQTFKRDSPSASKRNCSITLIETIAVELHLLNAERNVLPSNLERAIADDLNRILGELPDNVQVHEYADGNVHLKFELLRADNVDKAFNLEEMMKQGQLTLVDGQLQPDVTMSRFVHRGSSMSFRPAADALLADNAFQMAIVMFATISAFLISMFVIFIMLKRDRNGDKKTDEKNNPIRGHTFLDYRSPIFVLNANDHKPKSDDDI